MSIFKLNSDKQITLQAIGQKSREYKLRPKNNSIWKKFRIPMSRRHLLKWRTTYNKKSLIKERRLEDKRPLWWFISLISLAVSIPWLSNFALSAVAIFCIYASINLLWSLTLGTAGIFSLATMAVVGVSGYIAATANVYFGVPWPLIFVIGTIAGLIFGGFLALPSSRLDGLYYALLTLGLAEICRVFISQIHALTPTNGSINNVSSFIPEDWYLQRPGLLLGAASSFILLLLALLIYRLVNGEALGRKLQVARDDEEFAEAIGINYHSARLKVFLISCAGLGFIGAFYAMYFRSISLGVFSLDQLMLLFAMIVIGGTGRAEGAVVGTAIVILIDRGLFELGPMRIVIIAIVMILVTTYASNGITGIREQFRNFRHRFQTQKRSLITTKGGEIMPEEAIDIHNKQIIYSRRFNSRLRNYLKTLINDEVIAEHKANPVGKHSYELTRLLNYFRKAEVPDKYAVAQIGPLKDSQYKIFAFTGDPEKPPRVVDERVYSSKNEAYHAIFLLRVNDLLES